MESKLPRFPSLRLSHGNVWCLDEPDCTPVLVLLPKLHDFAKPHGVPTPPPPFVPSLRDFFGKPSGRTFKATLAFECRCPIFLAFRRKLRTILLEAGRKVWTVVLQQDDDVVLPVLVLIADRSEQQDKPTARLEKGQSIWWYFLWGGRTFGSFRALATKCVLVLVDTYVSQRSRTSPQRGWRKVSVMPSCGQSFGPHLMLHCLTNDGGQVGQEGGSSRTRKFGDLGINHPVSGCSCAGPVVSKLQNSQTVSSSREPLRPLVGGIRP